ncbi:ComEC/Rec2 family competence protein [Synechococcus sp. UW140]|uniref:ComEC/Rec2 family competence protein n=1 Tax=Synechococcus sp. UW140 TaxID=368503 RepID=UPI001FCC6BF3|nr:ComEC/Rec2 family competence protein [Synechococcus sp. UW140]
MTVQRIDGKRISGVTEVLLEPCSTPVLAGTWIRADGHLRRPAQAIHPLLPSPSERLSRLGCWTQFKVSRLERIANGWAPLAMARRLIITQLSAHLGPNHGAMVAALVLGGAQVDLPDSVRQAFRVAGLSHALAASGFHLSVLLGSVMLLSSRWPASWRMLAGCGLMLVFLLLAGPQPSVVRAVLMGASALLIREGGSRSRPIGLLLATLVLMLWWQPGWARSIGFQFSAVATAGLVVSAPVMETWLTSRLPMALRSLAPALAVPLAAMVWTLPLQWLHFGAMPLYGVLANLLASPLLMALTLAAMFLATLVLLLPQAVASLLLPVIAVPVQALAACLEGLVNAISDWPHAQLLIGRPSGWMVLVIVLAVASCCLSGSRRWRWVLMPLALMALLVHGAGLLADAVVRVDQWGRQWVLLRHQGRAALISSHGDRLSCRVAQQLAHGHGHARLDWIAVLDPVVASKLDCWHSLARTLHAEQLGQSPLRPGQRLASAGLVLQPVGSSGRRFVLQAGRRRVGLQRSQLRLQP